MSKGGPVLLFNFRADGKRQDLTPKILSELITEATDLDKRVERVPEDYEIAKFIRRG